MKSNSINKNSTFIEHNNVFIDDGTNKQNLTSTPIDCVKQCYDDPNCKGLNIIKNFPDSLYKCSYVENISYSNSKNSDENSKFFSKIEPWNTNGLNYGEYILETNSECMGVDTNFANSLVYLDNSNNSNDKNNKCGKIRINKDDTIQLMEPDNNLCLQISDPSKSTETKIFLYPCNTYNPLQKFIYENVGNSLRPQIDTSLSVTNVDGEMKIKKYEPDNKTITYFQNYVSLALNSDNIEYFSNNSTPTNYFIIYVIMLILIYTLVIIIGK